MQIYKFTDTDTEAPKEKDLDLKKLLSNRYAPGYMNIARTGIYKIHGWAVDFRDELNKYIIKTDYYFEETYHLTKTDLRKQSVGMGRIHYIIKLDN